MEPRARAGCTADEPARGEMMALRIALLAAIAAALAVPTAATAGGWATVGFDPPPEGLAPGEPSAGDDGPNVLLALGVAAIAALAAGLGAAYLQRRGGGGTSPAGG